MHREELIMVCYSDIAGQVRGKGFPARDLAARLESGIGWTPTNIMITAFGPIADSPWGPFGDLILLPDPATEVNVDFGDGTPAEHFFLADVLNTDRTPWSCCPRGFLERALDDLEREAGLRLFAAFEHEFYYEGASERIGSAYSLDAIRRQGAFAEALLHALSAAGLDPDSFLPEYGPRQYEVTVRPTLGVGAADRAVVLRELARATALRMGHKLSFAPMVRLDGGVGNGVHIHISLLDRDDRPVTYDRDGPGGLSVPAGRFIAGLLRHMPALCAIAAPSVISYLRLVPHKWSSAYNNLGYRDREAGVRICPVFETPGADPAAQFNFEVRTGDAAASPYLQLGAIVRAGLEGLRAELPPPEITERDPGEIDAAERQRLGIVRLPQSLAEALDALEADAAARTWFPDDLLDAYLRHKRAEIELMKALTPEDQCARYAEVY